MLLVGNLDAVAEGEWPSVEVERGGRQTAAVYAPRLHRARSCVKYVRYVKLKNVVYPVTIRWIYIDIYHI